MSPNVLVDTVEQIKARRVAIDAEIQAIRKEGNEEKDINTFDYELYLLSKGNALIALIEAKMWYGKMLEGLGNPFPAELADKADAPAKQCYTTPSREVAATGRGCANSFIREGVVIETS